MSADFAMKETGSDSNDDLAVDSSTDQNSAESSSGEEDHTQRQKNEQLLLRSSKRRWFATVQHYYYVALSIFLVHQGHKYYESFKIRPMDARGVRYLAFSYFDNQLRKKVHRAVHTEYGEDRIKQIAFSDLLSSKGCFSLVTLFYSYLELTGLLLKMDDEIKDIIIYTNLNFKLDDTADDDNGSRLTDMLEEIVAGDDILNDRYGHQTLCYQFSKGNLEFFKSRLLQEFKAKGLTDRLDDFLGSLVFVIDPANVIVLKRIVERGIGEAAIKELDNCIRLQNVYHEFKDMVLERLMGGCISDEDVKDIIKQIGEKDAPVSFRVDKPKSSSGDKVDLKSLHDFLQGDSKFKKSRSATCSELVSPQIVVIISSRKTESCELAKEYLAEYGKAYNNNHLWINATSHKTLRDSFMKLAERLEIRPTNIDGENKDTKSIVNEVFRAFCTSKCLFVFEDADDYEAVRQFLPSLQPAPNTPYILITSKNENWQEIESIFSLNKRPSRESKASRYSTRKQWLCTN